MKKIIVIVLVIISCISIASCTSNVSWVSFESYSYFNTFSRVVIEETDEKFQNEIFSKIDLELKRIDETLSMDANSDIGKFNKSNGGEIEISALTYEALSFAKEMYLFTEGAYNIACARLADLWGFSERIRNESFAMPYDRQDNALPNSEYIEAFKTLANGFSDVEVYEKEGKYFVQKPNINVTVDNEIYYMEIDVGGIGKGLAVDKIVALLKSYGIENGFVNLGNSSMHMLNNIKDKHGVFSIGIINPKNSSENYARVKLKNVAISTSGDYINFYEKDGKRYCHIINPETGCPIDNGISSVSVFSYSAMYCDALSTAISIKGVDAALNWSNNNDFSISVVLTDNNQDCYYTNEASFELIEKGFLKQENE